jgi:hypothetical protein
MNTSITSKKVAGQKEQVVRVVTDAVRKGMGMGVDKLSDSGVLNTSNLQRVLAQGDALASKLVATALDFIAELAENIIGYLKLISGAETITIGKTDGKGTIARAKDLFTGWLDSDFVNYGTDVKGKPTEEMPVRVYEMTKDGTFSQVFGGFGENLDRLCLSQDQIIRFVKDHKKWLRTDGYATFFLFKVGTEYFVAFVRWRVGQLRVYAFRFSHGSVWHAGYSASYRGSETIIFFSHLFGGSFL